MPPERPDDSRLGRRGSIVSAGASADPVTAGTKASISSLAHRVRFLDTEIAGLEELIEPLLFATAPELLALKGVGPDTAASLLITAGDNPERLRSEASWAHLCGVSPIQASSGKVTRHRLDRGGDRQANSALWRIVMVRIAHDPVTKAYLERRVREGRSKREVIRMLKRYVAREVYRDIYLAAESPAAGVAQQLSVAPHRLAFSRTAHPLPGLSIF